ncbi:tetratricopeptide repeat-containing sensor histidine kinase [Ekhidna sp.]|uniref:tetratricopeptide repeat-containing sensor histidine kinase n=1 Tax=Ekhidna sp. TaxID=2608089 RepID=UPI003BAB4109
MNFNQPAVALLALTLSFNLSAQVSVIDSLKHEIAVSESDTAKITLYIELAYESVDSAQIEAARIAYQLGRQVEDAYYKGRSEVIFGLFYTYIDLDSGMVLMSDGIKTYLNNNLTKKGASALWVKGLIYESNNNLDSAIAAQTKSFQVADQNDHFEIKADAASTLASILNVRGENVSALRYGLESLDAYKEANMKEEVGQTHNLIGIIYDQKGLYSEALDHYLQAREIAIEVDDVEEEILINNNMGVIYDNMGDSEKSLQYYSDALEKARIHDLEDSEATLLNNLSYIHLKKGDTTKGIEYLRKSLSIDMSDYYPCFESYPLEGIGTVYVNLNRLDSAEYFLNRALATAEKCEDVVVLTSVYKSLGILYTKRNQRTKGLSALKKSLEISQNSKFIVETKASLFELYRYYKSTGNSTEAMQYLERYQVLADSIYEAKNVEKATQLASEYEFRKQVALLDQDRLETEKRYTEEIEAKSKENRLVLLALVLFFLLALTLARSYFYIQKQNKKLKWLNDEKNKLMGIVAHDLRNPLNMIIGLMPLFQGISAQKKDKNLEKYLELLEISSERMRNMIDRVLDISAIENMKVNLKKEKTELSKLTHESIHNFDIIASQKEIKITDNIDKSEERFSNVDSNYLVQVIDNLLSNAIKFSQKGKQIEVSLTTQKDKHVISVTDEGPGISEEDQKILFESFKTLSSKPTAQERSTGLGLSIAYKFIHAMDGDIKCHSKVGEGTTFELIFDKV